MTIQESISADQAAVAAAQSVLDGANAQLAADEAKLAAAQPHLSLWAQVEAFCVALPEEARPGLMNLIASARALF